MDVSCCEGSAQLPENVQQEQPQHLVSLSDSFKKKTYLGSLSCSLDDDDDSE